MAASFTAFLLLARMLLITCLSIELNRNRKHGDIEMKELAWKPILSNLREALWELERTYLRLYFLDLGELPEDCPRSGDASYIDWLKRQEERSPLDETTLFIRFEHAYHHLNFAWNCRRTPEERVWRCADNDASRWTRFPDTAAFADLWPPDRTVKGHIDELHGKVNISTVRIFVHITCRKLRILCYLVAKEIGEEWVRPEGLFSEVDAQPLAEKDVARRMHRIYAELNTAWNSRRDKSIVTGRRAIERRRLFPSIFATGCHNMWRE